MAKDKVWECKIVVPGDATLPEGFDLPPRSAAQRAVEDTGVKTVAVFSGWGGKLTDTQLEFVDKKDDILLHFGEGMSASMTSMLLVARLDEMGILALHEGQTLADLAMAIDAIGRGVTNHDEPNGPEQA